MSLAQPRVVFLDAATYGDVSLAQFSEQWDCTFHQVTLPSETAARLVGHSIAVTNKVAIDEIILNAPQARDLTLIAVAATGTDIIDRPAAARRGVAVCNVPGYATQSVAQFTIALILELATGVGRYRTEVGLGSWERSPVFSLLTYPAVELAGKKLGIVGYGSIGKAVARTADALGMEILVAARPGSGSASDGRMPLAELLGDSDFVSLHCPLTPHTQKLIDHHSLGLMRRSAFLVNTARGGLVDESALIDTLRARRIAGAAVDVISEEPPRAEHPMIVAARELDNLLITPHTAWSAREARSRLLAEVAENIAAFLQGQERNRVA
jgi:glycerate dehydrogenase